MKHHFSPFVLSLLWILLIGTAALVPVWWFFVNKTQPSAPVVVSDDADMTFPQELVPSVEPIETTEDLDETLGELDAVDLDYLDAALNQIDQESTEL